MMASCRLSSVKFLTFIVLAMLLSVTSSSGACDEITVKDSDTSIIKNAEEGAEEGDCWELIPYDKNVTITLQNHGLFRVDNGSLVLNRSLYLDGQENRELCGYIRVKNPFEVEISYKGREIVMYIFVKATDDFPPQFNQSSYEIHIREHNDERQAVIHFTKDFIEDGDCLIEPSYNFNIKDSNDSSSFDITRGLIFVTSVLDYERQMKYLITVGLLSENGDISANVTVFVDDVDDENPYFGSNTYSLNVTETRDLSQAWFSAEPPLWAADGDEGINDTIEYSVLESDIDVQVNSTTREVQIRSVLDREDIPEHRVIIKAYQKNNPLRSATATLIINVQDVNDNLPEFTAKPQLPIKVTEGTPEGVLIVALPAQDKDEGENGLFSYDLEDESGAFDIKMDARSKTEWLFLKHSTALNATKIMDVKVILRPKVEKMVDGQSCDFITTCVLELEFHIVDVNNYDPVFEEATYIFNIQKDHLTIGTISATDRDKGDNGNVSYAIIEPRDSTQCQVVEINPLSGILSTAKPLSDVQSCSFKVQACDNPNEEKDKRCSSVPVFIKVNRLLRSYYNVSVFEDIAIGSIILQLPQMDLIVKDKTFSIKSGFLMTNGAIDKEKVDFFEIPVYSLLDDSKPLSVVNIQVLNVNDNAPVFKESVFRTNVSRNMKPGDKVIQIEASDADEGDNRRLTYSLLNGRDWFSINNRTGVISIIKQPLFGDMEKINLFVQVTDGGFPPLFSTGLIEVNINL